MNTAIAETFRYVSLIHSKPMEYEYDFLFEHDVSFVDGRDG
jgi:hypothetical protein